ncbi:MAG: hypothetical protein KAW86_05460 [Bacteroidales bacterium]|nr:hypothetical protein [Bacteroidales bacterium]
MKKLAFLITIFSMILLSSSCKKENESKDYSANSNAAKDYVLAEDIFKDIFKMVFRAGYDTVLHNEGYLKINEANVYYYTAPSLNIGITYGDWNILCPDGKSRRGKYYVFLDTVFSAAGSNATITFEKFYVNNTNVQASITMTNDSLNADNKNSYSILINNAVLLLTDSVSTVKWQSDKTFIWTEGDETPQDFEDDVFSIIGEANGTSSENNAFEGNIIVPLKDTTSCSWFESGKLNFYTPGLETKNGVIDFIPTDSCGNRVEFIFDGFVFYELMENIYNMENLK